MRKLQDTKWHPTLALLLGKSHGWRSLVGCSPWDCEESDTTERLHFHFSLSRIGEGNGSPLQCSCLENPRDRRAWQAAISGVPRSRTRLKRLSSSSSSSSLTFFSIFFSAHTSKMLLNSAIYLPITGIKNLASPLCFNNPLPQLVSYMFT